MAATYAKDYFVVNRWILKMVGLWRPDTNWELIQRLYTIYTTITFLYVNLYFTLTEFVSIRDTYGNVYDLIKNIGFAITHLLGASKVTFFLLYGEKLKSIMNTLESPVWHYENSESKNFYPGEISKKYKKEGIRYTIGFSLLCHITLLSAYLPAAISCILYDKHDPDSILPQKLPYYSWMPFSYNTQTTYLIALGYQTIPMFSHAYSICGMDTLFMNIMKAIALHLEIIQGAFLSVTDRAMTKIDGPLLSTDGFQDSEKFRNILTDEMKRVCKHLQTVYKVCDELEDTYKLLNLGQSLATLFILCSCLYLVTSTPINSEQFINETGYMVTMFYEIFLYCKFGDEVTLKADGIRLNLWKCDWLTADPEFKTIVTMTMTRTQKLLYLTAGKFVPLTLDTFVKIGKASYSLCAVIKNSNERG